MLNLLEKDTQLVIRVLGQNDPFFKLNVENGLIFKLLFKMASLMPRRRHVRVSNGPAGRAARVGLGKN